MQKILTNKGLKEGLKEGREEGKIEIAKNLLKLNIDIESISKATELTKKRDSKIKVIP